MTQNKKAIVPTAEKIRLVANWLREKKAKDVLALDVAAICSVTETMMIATAANVRQAQAMADHILKMCGEAGVSFLGMDGYKTGQWILVDLNDVLVHIFMDDARQFYNIEGLWAEGAEIALPEEPETPANTAQ